MKGTFKSIVDTNKVLGKYQGNAISLARILDKDAPADINLAPSGNIPKKREPKGQSHGAQSTAERERGIIEQQDDPRYHYSKPQSMSEHRKLVPHEEIGAPEHLLYEDVTSDSQAGSMRARRPYESMLKPNAILADPRKRKSFFGICGFFLMNFSTA